MQYPRMGIRILGKRWTIIFLPGHKFRSRYGRDTAAVTEIQDKRIYLNRSKTSFEDVVHELTHAYLDETCVGNSLDLNVEQLEEAYCELMAKFGHALLQQARKIKSAYDALKKR